MERDKRYYHFLPYAQHAFAEMSLSAGIPIENIAKMKAHVSISSTQIYALMTACKISA